MRIDHGAVVGRLMQRAGEEAEIERDAEQREAGDQHAGDGAGLEGELESPPASDLVAACATRTLARTETFMPMKPVAPDSTAPTAKPTRDQPAERKAEDDER